MMAQLQSMAGLIVIPLLAWAMTEDRKALGPVQVLMIVATGLVVQVVFAALFIYIPQLRIVFDGFAQAVVVLQNATEQGLRVVFGYLAGGPQPFEISNPGNGYILAFRGLPLILVMSVLTRLLYLWGVLPLLVKGIAWVLQRSLGVGGPLGAAAAANIFVGMVEGCLMVRPYLKTMSRGALFATMSVGMATLAGTMMALYASILGTSLPGAAGHILVASLISAPAALMIARLMVPAGFAEGPQDVHIELPEQERTIMGAIAQGTLDGLKLLALVAAMLVVMIALVALLNSFLAWLGGFAGFSITFEKAVGFLCAPLAWLIGIPFEEIWTAGSLIGIKVVLNEFLAYLQLAEVPAEALSERSRLILTYALCGFANFGSLGIMTGGLVAMVPERWEEIVVLGPKTIISGLLATLMTGAVIGMLTPS